MNKRRITGIAGAVLLGIIGMVAILGYVNSVKDKAETREAMTKVLVVSKLVPKGADAATIKAALATVKVPRRLVQGGAVKRLGDVKAGDVAAADLQPGDQLITARLLKKGEAVEGTVEVAARFSPERAVGGALAKGDTVGVFLSFDPTAGGQSAAAGTSSTHLEFQKVLVTDVQTTNLLPKPDDNKSGVQQVSGAEYIVTLALTPAQSERFVFATEFGHVWLANEPATVSDDGTKITTMGNAFAVTS